MFQPCLLFSYCMTEVTFFYSRKLNGYFHVFPFLVWGSCWWSYRCPPVTPSAAVHCLSSASWSLALQVQRPALKGSKHKAVPAGSGQCFKGWIASLALNRKYWSYFSCLRALLSSRRNFKAWLEAFPKALFMESCFFKWMGWLEQRPNPNQACGP